MDSSRLSQSVDLASLLWGRGSEGSGSVSRVVVVVVAVVAAVVGWSVDNGH